MSSLFDYMSAEDKTRALSSFQRRMTTGRSDRQKVSPEIYLIAELGYHYGWGAIESVKRGYIESFNDETGEREHILLTLEEVSVLVEAARKVWYSKVVDQARGTQIAAGSALSKSPASSFKRGIKPYSKACGPDKVGE